MKFQVPVLNPLRVRSSALARKLPAAALTRMSKDPPKTLRVCVKAAEHSVSLRTSASALVALIPDFRRTETASSRTSTRRPSTQTQAPWRPTDQHILDLYKTKVETKLSGDFESNSSSSTCDQSDLRWSPALFNSKGMMSTFPWRMSGLNTLSAIKRQSCKMCHKRMTKNCGINDNCVIVV